MSNQVYKKVGEKFIKIGPSDGWYGFPTEGVWLVTHKPNSKSSSWIAKLSEVPNITKTIEFRSRIDIITKSISNYFDIKKEEGQKNGSFSYGPREMADKIINDLSEDYIQNTKIQNRRLLLEKISYEKKQI